MFTEIEREKIRAEILEKARQDNRISGAAVTGSATTDSLDPWSDIDLAFGVLADKQVSEVLKDFTDFMYSTYGALHHLDVPSGAWIYRVFFLSSTLQVDLAFVDESNFGARAPTFKLMFGKANQLPKSENRSASFSLLI